MARTRGRKQEALGRLFAEVKKRCGNGSLIFDNQLAKGTKTTFLLGTMMYIGMPLLAAGRALGVQL